MKKILLVLIMLVAAYGVQAQSQQSTATPSPADASDSSASVEATAEAALLMSDIYDELPQSRTEDGAFVLGDPEAPVTLIVFSDWACPHCQTYHALIDPLLTDYLLTGQVKFEMRMVPTAGGMMTVFAGTLAECADDMAEGGFWHSFFQLYELALAGEYDTYIITTTIARQLDLDPDALYECTREIRQMRTDVDLANAFGIQGTPAVMIRYGDGDPEFAEVDGVVFNRGSLPEDTIRQIIENAAEAAAER